MCRQGWGQGCCQYTFFLVPIKCSVSQLSEDQFVGPKRPVQQQNKQRVWRLQPGQGANFITRDVLVNSPSQHPPLPRRLWGRGEGTCSSAPAPWPPALGTADMPGEEAPTSPRTGAAVLAVDSIQGSH